VSGVGTSGKPVDYRGDIDGLRAIAVLSVIGYHAFPISIRGGFTGVDVFFVISGFLISGLIFDDARRQRFSFRKFYARRFRRIFPALIVILLSCLVYGWVALAPDEYRDLGQQVAAGAGFSSNILLWIQSGYFDQEATTKPLLHLWSLGVEEQFYLAWPIVIVMVYRNFKRLRYVLFGLITLSFISSIVLTHTNPSAAFYLTTSRFWELLLGALLAYRIHSRTEVPGMAAVPPTHDRYGGLRAWLGLLSIAAGFFLINSDSAFPGWWALLPTLGTALAISAPHAWPNRAILSAKPLVYIGLISYPLYLWHWILLTFMRIANYGEPPLKLWRLVAIAASVVLAWLTYVLVEKPIRFGGNRNAIPRTLLACMAVCALAGFVIYATDGCAFRYPKEIRALAAFHYDSDRDFYEQAYREGDCFLSAKATFADIAAQCVDDARGTTPLVALWGDSHAASLYPGLRELQKQGAFRIAQFTASACPPIIGLHSERRRNCESFNDSVIVRFRSLLPDVLILEAHWALYSGANGWPDFDISMLRRTIEALQAMGIHRIVVMGSLPTWKIHQPRIAFELWRQEGVIQDRTAKFLDAEPFSADRSVRSAVLGTEATFISPIDFLCESGACLISTDPHIATPVAWDNDHLSLAGSAFLVEHAFKSILALPN
jgi:peptidoglycan/LPS O-acetylase OafA/YrhL